MKQMHSDDFQEVIETKWQFFQYQKFHLLHQFYSPLPFRNFELQFPFEFLKLHFQIHYT